MKNLRYSLFVAGCLSFILCGAQEFKTPLSEFKVEETALVVIEASYAEIEIEEWNKNKVEVQGIMRIQGMEAEEAQDVFDSWKIITEASANKVKINSNSNTFGNEYFFIHNDKYLGNIVVDIPEISAHVMEALDSIHIVLPEITEFPDIGHDFDFDFDMDFESLNFDYEEFQKNSDYLQEWQEKNKKQLKQLKEELKANQRKMALEEKEVHKQMIIIQQEASEEARREIEEQAREIEEHSREMEVEMRERETEIQKIIEKRQKIKVTRILKVKVPKKAKLEMDVDYCKISTLN